MATPRSKLVDSQIPYAYHIISRCVRRSFLCGIDSATGQDYTHRKTWIIERMASLTPHFPVEVYAYSIMSNHFHMVVHYDPQAQHHWPREEVARRWCAICPKKRRDGSIDEVAQAVAYCSLLANNELLESKRAQLGNLSTFMKFLKQPIACAANQEDGCGGHFFEKRFYSGVLLSDEAMAAAMAYVDLNPVRAKLAQNIQDIDHASITQRMQALENSTERIEQELDGIIEPVLATSAPPHRKPFKPRFTLRVYLQRLEEMILHEQRSPASASQRKLSKWVVHVQMFGDRQRAYGSQAQIEEWTRRRGLQCRERGMLD